jgi:hypothetical protein
MSDVLTREHGIENWITPTGRQLGLINEEWNPSMMRIAFVDGKPGALPDVLQGHFTKRKIAADLIEKYLKEFWDMSDSKKKEKAA